MRRIHVVKTFIAALIISVAVFGFITGCDDNNGGGGNNCCQFLETCQGKIGQNNCTDQGGQFIQNAQCFEDVGLCVGVATPTPTPAPTATPTPQPTATPTPSPTPTPQPSVTPTPSPTPTPTVSPSPTPTPGPATCADVPDRMDDVFFEQNAVTYTGELVPMACAGGGSDGNFCETNEDCPGGACVSTVCDGGGSDGDPCQTNEDCPGGACVEADPVQVVKVLTSDLTPPAMCTVVVNTTVMGLPATITLTGPIEEDGVTCTFDGTNTTVVSIINIPATIVSGSAMLSGDGQVLSLSAIVADLGAPIDMQVTIPGVGPCNYESVEPIDQQARTQDAQRIQSEKMQEYGIGTGN